VHLYWRWPIRTQTISTGRRTKHTQSHYKRVLRLHQKITTQVSSVCLMEDFIVHDGWLTVIYRLRLNACNIYAVVGEPFRTYLCSVDIRKPGQLAKLLPICVGRCYCRSAIDLLNANLVYLWSWCRERSLALDTHISTHTGRNTETVAHTCHFDRQFVKGVYITLRFSKRSVPVKVKMKYFYLIISSAWTNYLWSIEEIE